MKIIQKITLAITLFFLFWITSSFAGFTLGGTTITQTGTDANLSGLSGIAGVTTIVDGASTKTYTTYSIGDLRLVINWTLNHDPAAEKLIIGDGVTWASLLVNGTYNYGTETIFSWHTHYSTELWLVITRLANSNFNTPVLDINPSGIFNWNGWIINTGWTVYFRWGSSVVINDAVINIQNPWGWQLIRSFTANLTVNGLRKIWGGTILYQSPVLFNWYEPIHSDLSPQAASRNDYALLLYWPPTGTSDVISVRDFAWFGNPNEIGFIDNSKWKFINPLNGSNTTFAWWLGADSRSDTYIEITKELEFNFSDSNWAWVDAKIYISDDNSWNRLNQNGENHIADKIYNITTAWSTASFEVINGIVNVLNGVNHTQVDKRFADNSLTSFFGTYNYQLSQTNIKLLGNGNVVTNWTLFDDPSISQPTKSIVDGYTTIDSSAQFYDRAKAHLFDNYVGETQTIVTKNGSNIDAGSYNVIVDATAASAFAFNGFTVTIRSSAFIWDITTSGTVTLLNGAIVNGIVSDINGTTSTLELTGIPAGSSVFVMDDVWVQHVYNANQSWTFSTSIPASATGIWTYVVKKAWFTRQIGNFTPIWIVFSFSVALPTIFQSNGVTMYSGSSSSLIDIEFAGLSQMSIDIADWVVDNQRIYDEVEDALETQPWMLWLANNFAGITISNLSAGSFVFLTDSIRFRRNTPLDANATVDSFVVSTEWVFVDSANGGVQILSSNAQNVTILESEKVDIADRVTLQIEWAGSLLSTIYDFISDLLTRIVSIKSDSQKIN